MCETAFYQHFNLKFWAKSIDDEHPMKEINLCVPRTLHKKKNKNMYRRVAVFVCGAFI